MDSSIIISTARDFLIALARGQDDVMTSHLSKNCLYHMSDGQTPATIITQYQAYAQPSLFEFEAPVPISDGYTIKVFLHDGRGKIQPVLMRFKMEDEVWTIDDLIWKQPIAEW